MPVKKVLTIAGSDSSAGAGLQADLKTLAAMRVYGLSVVTAVTAQNTVGVTGVHPIPPEFVGRQIDAVFEDIPVDAVKTGMLATSEIVETVSEKLKYFQVSTVVVDPVMVATSGDMLTSDNIGRLIRAIRNTLLPIAAVVTPNIPEAEILTGREIRSVDDMKAAAADLQGIGVSNVVIKGGHLAGTESVDLLFDGSEFIEYRNIRLATNNTHGTGCTFAAALTAGLAKGRTVREAVGDAKQFVYTALQYGFALGRGRGPVHHFAKLYGLTDAGEK